MSCERVSRRGFLRAVAGAGAVVFKGAPAMADALIRKAVRKTGEELPAIGLGTWQTFDVGATKAAREPLRAVLQEFVRAGGTVLDSSPMYGRSETVAGDLAAELGVQKNLFFATKVWTSGREAGIRQMEESFRRLRIRRMDLLQVHNLVDYRTQLATLRRWKDEGRVRYIGVTHYTAGAYDDLARVIGREELDFVQLNYSIAERDAEKRLLSLAAERKIAVLFNRGRGQALPPWAEEIGCASWAQVFLKFVISHPAVTCAIPATAKAEHLIDNMHALRGPLPDAAARERIARYVAEL